MKRLLLCVVLLAACSNAPQVLPTTITTTQAPKPIHIAAVGDISCSNSQRQSGDYPCADALVAQAIRFSNPDYFIPLGDLQYNTATYDLLMGVYDKTWRDFKDISLPVLGNHDYPADGFMRYFPEMPESGYYSQVLNDKWMVIVLNTNDDCQIVACDPESEQYHWLIKTLDANPSRCAVVAMHHPRFSSGAHGNSEAVESLWQVLESRKVPVVFSGHDHHYERFNTAPVQIVVGTGGKELRGIGTRLPESVFATNEHHGYSLITISENVLKADFINTDGVVVDTITTTCKR